MAFPAPGEPRSRRSFGAGVTIGVLIALVVGLTVTVAVLILNENAGETAAPAKSPSMSPTPTPSPTQKPNRVPAQVRTAFHEQEWVKGERLWLGAGIFQLGDDECSVHAYALNVKAWGAFQTDCRSWESDGYDVIIFQVGLRNPMNRAVSFNLRNFVLTSRDQRTFGPVNVRSQAEFPPNFLPEAGKIPPRSNLSGYLTFDGRVTGMVPARLSYVDGRQTLTIVFKGRHSVA